MLNALNEYYTGTIDNLLIRIDNYDLMLLEEAILIENAIEDIMDQSNEPREIVVQMLEQAHLNEVQKEVDKMLKEGLVEIVGHNENGEPLYRHVEVKKKKK